MNTTLFQLLKKLIWVINIMVLNYFLNQTVMMSGLKIKNRLIQQNVVKNLTKLPSIPALESVHHK